MRKNRRRLLGRLIFINSLGLLGFMAGILWLGQTRESLTEGFRETLHIQARMMAEALGEAAGGAAIELDVDGTDAGQVMTPELQKPEAEQVMRRLMAPTQNRARLYRRDGRLLVDSDLLLRAGQVIARELPPPETDSNSSKSIGKLFSGLTRNRPVLSGRQLVNGLALEEIQLALQGGSASRARQNPAGEDILTVAVPVQGYRAIIGVLLLTSAPGEIDNLVARERWAMLRLFLVIFGVTIGLSVLLAGTITMPVRRLATALQTIRDGGQGLPEKETIPDLSDRRDEIGDLSVALREMLGQLLARLDAIDNFAADVAHEMKNPLASINSAIQSFTKTEDAADQAALLEIIENDVQRLNRLISDISEASRLDAELGRAAHEPFDMAEMTRKIVPLVSPEITLAAALTQRPEVQLMVSGQKERIGRVLYNLLDNAMSFSPHTKIKVSLSAEEENILLTVEDAGPGLTPGSEEKIFERFYTDRAGGEGSHSGLGLSLSRQIARAHGGDLVAMNRPDEAGAKFLLTLPLASAVKAKTVKNKTAQSKKGASR